MASTITDRTAQVGSSASPNAENATVSVKQPVRGATTANITLSGTQTIDGVAVVANDRVLVKDQSTATENGIYVVASGAWTRAKDCADNGDLVTGTEVRVNTGSTNQGRWYCSASDPIVIGTSNITWVQVTGIDVADGDKGDVAVSSGGAVWTVEGSTSATFEMTGAFFLNSASNALAYLDANASTNVAELQFRTNGDRRWVWSKDGTAESSTATGSDLQLYRYNNAGAYLDSPIVVTRETGDVTIANDLRIANGTAAAPSLTFASDPDTGIYRAAANDIGFTTGGIVRGRLDGRTWLFGNADENLSGTAIYCNMQNNGGSTDVGGNYGQFQYSADTSCSFIAYYKSRNATKNSHTAVQSGDDLGEIQFNGSDGTSFVNGGHLVAAVDSSVTTDSVPMSLTWWSHSPGATNTTIKFTISSAGNATFAGPVKTLTTTVASLPAASVGAGFRAFVTDANATTFNSVVAGGGANNVPVFSDGTNWRIG